MKGRTSYWSARLPAVAAAALAAVYCVGAAAARGGTVVRQTSRATCGPAALATLFTFYFNDPVTEEEAVRLAGADRKTMTNLRQLGEACRAKGYGAEGRRWNLARLAREADAGGVPVLVHLKRPTEHFVLVVGRAGEFFLVADPERGDMSIHQTDLVRRWDGNVLVVRSARPVNAALIESKRRAAEARLRTLGAAGSLMSAARF